MENKDALVPAAERETSSDAFRDGDSAKRKRAAFAAPYNCFWIAVVGLALEGCAGEFRRFTVPPAAATGQVDIAMAQTACAILAALVLFAAFRNTRSFTFKRTAWGIGASVAFTLGLAFYFQESIFVTSVPFLSNLGYYLAVISAYLYLFVWFDRLFAFGFKSTLITIGASLVLRGLCQMLLLLLQQTPGVCLLSVLPLVSLPFFLRVHAETEARKLGADEETNATFSVGGTKDHHGNIELGALLVIVLFIAILSNSGLAKTI